MPRTKVTFLISRFLDGGIDTILVQYLNNLDRQKYEVSLVIALNYEGLEVYKRLIASDVKIYYLVKDGLLTSFTKKKLRRKLSLGEKIIDAIALNPVRRVLQRARLANILRGQDVVVDMDCMFHSFIGGFRGRKIAFFHFSIPEYCCDKERKIKRLGQKFNAYDKVVFVSDKMREQAVELYPDQVGKFVMIYNPQNIEALQERASQFEVDDDDYILTIARIEESQKDYTTLIKAYRLAKDELGERLPKLRIIGKGQDRDAMQRLADELGIGDSVVFMGVMPNPMPWLVRARAFVLSSKFEGLPVSLVEALLLNVPIIASDCPVGPREVLNDGKCGTLVPVGDVNLMAKAIVEMVTDGEMVARYKAQEAEHAKKFVWAEASRKFSELCEGLNK